MTYMSNEDFEKLTPFIKEGLGPITEDESVLHIRVQVIDPSTRRFVDVEKEVAMRNAKEWFEFFALGLSYVFQNKTIAWRGTIKLHGKKIVAIKVLREISGFSPVRTPNVQSNVSLTLKEAKESIEGALFHVFVVGERAKAAVEVVVLGANLSIDFERGAPPKSSPEVRNYTIPVIFDVGIQSQVNLFT